MKALVLSLALVGITAANAEAQQVYDKVSALPMVQRVCANSLLSHPELVANGEMLGITVNEICGCQARMLVSALSIQELQLIQQGRFTSHAQEKFNQAMQFCNLDALTKH